MNKATLVNFDDMTSGWLKLEHLLGEYNAVLNGQEATIYNSPNIVEVDLGDRK